jgi:hypothetical protein
MKKLQKLTNYCLYSQITAKIIEFISEMRVFIDFLLIFGGEDL